MRQVVTLQEWREATDDIRRSGRRVGLIPTMGALHAGHRSLIQRAIDDGAVPCVTIFVNPRQFNDLADLHAYPQPLESDLRQCHEWGAEVVFTPAIDEMWPSFPHATATTVHVAGVTEEFEGAGRPGHFDGVASVVTKIFVVTGPSSAYFGEKDFQQLAMVRRLVSDVGFDIEIVGCPIVRDDDGLALSSRNARLSPAGRSAALAISRALNWAGDAPRTVDEIDRRVRATLTDAGIDVAYVAVVDSNTLQSDVVEGAARVLVAGTIEGVRLLDNAAVVIRKDDASCC
jgi:pantoate--beta-alanine ligase